MPYFHKSLTYGRDTKNSALSEEKERANSASSSEDDDEDADADDSEEMSSGGSVDRILKLSSLPLIPLLPNQVYPDANV
jgi:hypothetical protein